MKQAEVGSKARTLETLRGRTWVTRQGVHVDRIGSAWLIRRFIDPDARFKFVPGKGYRPDEGELRFDMFQAEFTHEGDKCTFEVLLDRAALKDSALRAIAEIIHDIDLRTTSTAARNRLAFVRSLTASRLRPQTTWSASRAAQRCSTTSTNSSERNDQ